MGPTPPVYFIGLLASLLAFWPAGRAELAEPYTGERTVSIASGASQGFAGPVLDPGQLYSVLVYLPALANLGEQDALTVTVADAAGAAVAKTLHGGDPDFYLTFRAGTAGAASLRVAAAALSGEGKTYSLRYSFAKIQADSNSPLSLAALPNSDWRRAQPMVLGQTIYGSNDERPFIPRLADPKAVLDDLTTGGQWFTFEQAGPGAKLVHFMIDVLDRDVPVDVALFTRGAGGPEAELEPYNEGMERYNTEQSTRFHGLQKFVARVVKPGTYYVRVMGNHPFYGLRTVVYDPPPYTEPGPAIRAAMDYALRKGDSWHANTPRRGSVVLRTSNRLGETAQCIACHPTHFTTRAELIGIENGWPLRERPALQFLTERLYNNPRPLYGETEAVWSRMISAPANVLSRLAYLLVTFEKNVSLESRDGLLGPIGAFLEEYWQGVKSPITESNGNTPRVSGFEVALHSGLVFAELFRRTGDEKYLALRRQVEQVTVQGEPVDMIDLCWQIVALCEFDRAGLAGRITEKVNELFAQQKANGTWSVTFNRPPGNLPGASPGRPGEAPKDPDGTPKESEFQTYHALYALAKAGLPADDPRVARSLTWCLSRQWPHGGWQGNTDFKNFDTVFRDTQYAIMALTEFHRRAGAQGWNAGFAPPAARLETSDVGALLAALDQHWAPPPGEVLDQARQLLRHELPLVRFAAAALLGRVGDSGSLPVLVTSLGDGSKLVQRAAAWAVRQIVSRRGAGHDQVLAALNSPDDRTRAGALRIFNQHFKYLTSDWRLGEALLARLEQDPVPIHRVQAAQALWQWWFWDAQTSHRVAIEDAFIAALARPQHPWTRRNLIESVHNLLDDNVRYLYNDWIPALKSEEARQRVKAGHQATVLRQARKVAAALSQGNDSQRDGLLRSFYTFHLRETAADLPRDVAQYRFPETYQTQGKRERGENTWLDGYQFAAAFDPGATGLGALGRIGNDTEPPVYDQDSGPVLAAGLRDLLTESGRWTLPVLRVLRSTRGVPLDASFSSLLWDLASQPAWAEHPEAAALFRELLPARLALSEEGTARLAGALEQGSGSLFGLAVAIVRATPQAELRKSPVILEAVRKRSVDHPLAEADQGAWLDLLLATVDLQPLTEVRERVVQVTERGSERLRRQAMRTLLQGERFLLSTRARKAFESDLHSAQGERWKDWLAAAATLDWQNGKAEAGVQLALGIVTAGLRHPEAGVRLAAIQVVKDVPSLVGNPAVRECLRLLGQEADAKVGEPARALLATLQADTGEPRAARLDFGYFVKHVQPIFERTAADGDSCAKCHANHSILRLIPAEPGQALSEDDLRFNYLSALKVTNPTSPEESLLLIKPRSTFEGIGQPENYRKTHGGDVRWPEGKASAEYEIIVRWIRGEKESALSSVP